jgi:hypothetical protein
MQVLPQYRTPGADMLRRVRAAASAFFAHTGVFVDGLSDIFSRLGNKSDAGAAGIA